MAPTVPAAVLKRFARQQRANAVQAETILWRALRDRRFAHARFRRQAAIGDYIVDFVCFERRLAIEAQATRAMNRSSRIANATPGCAVSNFAYCVCPTNW